MDIFQKIAEQKIREAIERGELDNLKNAGRPLRLDDDSWVPEDLRAAYRVLKNAGCLPPEMELKKEIISLKDLIYSLDDDQERMKKIRELNFKILQLNTMRQRPFYIEDFPEYEDKLYQRLL